MCRSRVHKRPHIKLNAYWVCSVFSALWFKLHTLQEQYSPPFLGCFNLHTLVGRNISLRIIQGFHSLPECDHWKLRCPKGQKDMIYLICVPRPKGILLSLVEIWVQSLLAYCNKAPNTKMVFQVRPHQDCKERKCSSGSAWNGDFPPAAETKPSSFPLKYRISYEIRLLSCPSRSFLGLTNFQVRNFLGISVFLINFHSCVSFSKWNLGILKLV